MATKDIGPKNPAIKVGEATLDYVDHRTGVKFGARWFLFRNVPAETSWFQTLGFTALALFGLQAVTGIILAMYYRPDPDRAYQSIQSITDEVTWGWLVRGMHKWGASAMIVVVFLHLGRVFFFGSYKYPRELTWVTGALLLIMTMFMGLTGYLLVWDQKAYWATVVGTNIAGSAPFIGGAVLELLRGGEQLGAVTLARFYGIHIWVLPAALLLLVGAHLFAVIRQGIAASPRNRPLVEPVPGLSRREAYQREYGAEKRAGKPFWEAVLKDAIVAAILTVVLVALALGPGAPLEAQADPNITNYVPRPEWYFLDLFQLLWYFTGSLEPLLIFLVFTLASLVFIFVPFLDRGRYRHPRQRPVAMALTAAVVAGVLGLTYLGAAGSPPGAVRVPPTDGMSAPELAGLQVYNEQGCTACHQINGLGGQAGPDLSRAGRLDEADIRRQIVTPQGEEMPPYDGLSPQQLDDLVAFLKSLE
jgi:ubiquinol-cytochrome c reductase cytochrome b subunit